MLGLSNHDIYGYQKRKCLIFLIALIFSVMEMRPASSQNRPAPAAQNSTLYFLAVGSEEYLYSFKNGYQPSDDRPNPYGNLPGASSSAAAVADTLVAAGAENGILLVSDGPDAMVTRDDVYNALTTLKEVIRRDLSETSDLNPRIVVYVMGHGFGDEAARSLYMLPGNIAFDGFANQTGTIKLIKKSIWSWDLVSALVNFREHQSMRHFDDFFPSLVMPDLTDFGSFAEVARRQAELQAADAARQEAPPGSPDAYRPDGNPPVPFVILFDNCFNGVEQDLTSLKQLTGLVKNFFSPFVDATMGEILNEGLAYYATAPGELAVPVSDRRGEPPIGPLALHFTELLKRQVDVGSPLTLRELQAAFGGKGDTQSFTSPVNDSVLYDNWRPFDPAVETQIRADTIDAEIIPFSENASGRYETIKGTGSREVLCCR